MGINPKLPEPFKSRRAFDCEVRAKDLGEGETDDRVREMSISSELPRLQWFWNTDGPAGFWERGWEVLSHEDKAVDLSRLNNSAPLLENHNIFDNPVGAVVEGSARIEDKKIRLSAKISRTDRGNDALLDIDDKIRGKTSAGYEITEFTRTEGENEGDFPTYLATKWSPYEATLATVPFDDAVGVGRSSEPPPLATAIETSGVVPSVMETETERKERSMGDEPKKPDETGVIEIGAARDEGINQGATTERNRSAGITDLAKRFKHVQGVGEEAMNFINSDRSVDEFKDHILKVHLEAKPVEEIQERTAAAQIGLTTKEIESFSIMRCIRSLANEKPEEAAFERECSKAVEGQLNKSARGIMIPHEVLTHQDKRILNVATPASAGDLVAQTLLSGSFIDLLRNAMKVRSLGATVLTGLRDDIDIPRQTGGATASWIAEGAAAPDETQTFDQVQMRPSTLAVSTEFTRKLMIQSSLDIEALVRRDLAFAIALEVDRVAINGSGAGSEPFGILNTAGIGDVSAGDPNGGVPSHANIVELETDVASSNAAFGMLAYLTNAVMRGKLKTIEKATNTGLFVWPDPLMVPDTPGEGVVNGYRASVSNQVPSNLVEGTSGATLSAMIFANWMDLLIGEWGAVDIVTNQFSKLLNGIIQVVAFSEWDIALRHPESFSAIKDGITL